MKSKIKEVNDLCLANGAYINQHGKKTVSAWSKVKYFREVFGTEFGINTMIVEHSDRYVIVKSLIMGYDPERIISTGFSKQYRDKPGYLSSAETFAISRALSFMGILLEDITSKEEYEELDIPVQPMNGKDTTSNNKEESFSLADLDDDLIQNLIEKDVSKDEESYKMR